MAFWGASGGDAHLAGCGAAAVLLVEAAQASQQLSLSGTSPSRSHTLLRSYLWITIFYNLTYTVALYALLLFYLGTHELLAPFNPLLKFALVKAVIFLSYWQGLFIAIATSAGAIATGARLRWVTT